MGWRGLSYYLPGLASNRETNNLSPLSS
jgi:hypothetical protein